MCLMGIHACVHATHFIEHLLGARHWSRREHEKDKNSCLTDPIFITVLLIIIIIKIHSMSNGDKEKKKQSREGG